MSEAALKTVDTRLSLAALAAVGVQTALALMWTGAAAERLRAVEAQAASAAELSVRLARLDEQIVAMRAQLLRIETKLEGER
jgi:hypothetical protein